VGAVFAGFVCGYAVALLTTPALAITLLRLRAGGGLVSRLIPPGVNVVGLSVILHGALFLFWTGAGIILGLFLLAMDGAGSGLGSANAPFSLFILAGALALGLPVALLFPRLRPAALACSVFVLLVFGWLMPHMATWTNFEAPPRPPRPHVEQFNA
jgi:hypothetical protein